MQVQIPKYLLRRMKKRMKAQKNPKRLFEAGLSLGNQSGKHVHFLIDEIDDLLNNDQDVRKHFDLTKEFQILMDGVVSYRNLSIWGATNNPERIPLPMIRRFNKVLIVGELNLEDRKELLKYYIGHMPLADFPETVWIDAAKKLDGATGDVIRKVADDLWRKHMSAFVSSKPDIAQTISMNLKMPKTAQIFLELEATSKKKNEVVKAQQYELASQLRDEERKIKAKYDELRKDEIPFHVDTFNRDLFKKTLSEHVVLSGAEIIAAVDASILNIGIASEIEMAVKVYQRAKQVISIASN